jgi:hypothetical protein
MTLRPLLPLNMSATVLLGALLHGHAVAGPSVDVWLDLSEPPPGLQTGTPSSLDRIARLRAQQDGVAAQLPALGAVELARVQRVGNAIAVRVDADRLSDLQALPGVKRVRPARSLHPPKPMP